MNILIIFPHKNALNPTSGATTRSWSIAQSLTKNNFKISILHSLKTKGLEDRSLKKKCNVHYHRDLKVFGLKEKFFNDLNPYLIIKLFRLLRREKFDVIHIISPFGVLLLKLLSNKKSLIILDSLGIESEFLKVSINYPQFPRYLLKIMNKFIKLYEKLACKLADVIINVSEIDRNYYIKNYKIKKSKTIVIPVASIIPTQNFKRTEDFKKKCRKKLGLPLNKTIVVFHGVLQHPPNKEAVKLIRNYIAPNIKSQNIRFVLAGQNMKKYKENNIISLDFVKNLSDLLYAADFAIVPIISGGGMRVKCSDYINTALPFISTKKGIEGISFLKEGFDYFLYDTVNNDFLEGIRFLSNNKEFRLKMHENLLKKSKLLNQKEIEQKLINLYTSIVKMQNQ